MEVWKLFTFENLKMQSLIYHFLENFRRFLEIQPVRGAIAVASEHSLMTNILAIAAVKINFQLKLKGTSARKIK